MQHEIRDELADTMQEKVGVFRTESDLREAQATVEQLREQFKGVIVTDKGRTFNQSLIHTIETGYLLDLAATMVTGAVERTESRGAHSRLDHPERDDDRWMKHTLSYLEDDQIRLDYSEVTMTTLRAPGEVLLMPSTTLDVFRYQPDTDAGALPPVLRAGARGGHHAARRDPAPAERAGRHAGGALLVPSSICGSCTCKANGKTVRPA